MSLSLVCVKLPNLDLYAGIELSGTDEMKQQLLPGLIRCATARCVLLQSCV